MLARTAYQSLVAWLRAVTHAASAHIQKLAQLFGDNSCTWSVLGFWKEHGSDQQGKLRIVSAPLQVRAETLEVGCLRHSQSAAQHPRPQTFLIRVAKTHIQNSHSQRKDV